VTGSGAGLGLQGSPSAIAAGAAGAAIRTGPVTNDGEVGADGGGLVLGDEDLLQDTANGEGISVSTLSVDTSRSGSSTAIVSPTPFSHRVTVPSVTDSPRAGMVTRWDICVISSSIASRCSCGACGSCGVRCWLR
jgi:hypothetical protein